MKKHNLPKKLLIFALVLLGITGFLKTNEVKVNAESNGWVFINNSWRYYSGPVMKTGWVKYNKDWYYLDDNGMIKKGWIKSEGKWYYLDSRSGKMITGWIEYDGNWYYLNSSGEMKIGWFEECGNHYYLDELGIMVNDTYVGSYYLGQNGVYQNNPWHNKNNDRR